jgi:hypothetical protein
MKGWIIFVVSLVLYGVSVFGGFIQDDLKIVSGDPEMGKISPLVATWTRPYYYLEGPETGVYRPLTSFSLYLNALVLGTDSWGFRLVNVLFYSGVCFLVYEVFKKIFEDYEKSPKNEAFLFALLFLVLPIHTEVVNNIVGRAEMLSLGFVLLAIILQYKKKWELSAFAFFLALLSKETAIVGLPVLLYLILTGKGKKDLKVGVAMFYAFVTVTFLVLRMMVLGGNGLSNNATMVENHLRFVSSEVRVQNAFALVPFGIGKVVFPINLSYDYSFNQLKLVSGWFDWKVLLGILLMAMSLGSLFTKLRGNKLWILGQAFFWGPLLITGNFLFPIGTIFGERLWFWPSLGMVMMALSISCPAVHIHLKNRTLFCLRKSRPDLQPKTSRVRKDQAFWLCAIFSKLDKYFGLLLILVLLSRTMVRNIDWLSQERLFVHDAGYVQNSVMAQSNKAAILLMSNDLEGGKVVMEKADEIYPKYPELLNNWGMYYLWTGDKDKAMEKFEECLVERPGFYLCEGNLGLVK